MGARSKRGFRSKRGPALHTRNSNNNGNNNNNRSDGASEGVGLASAPACVSKLYAPRWEEVEEACTNIISFALQPQAHATLLSHGVPQRLAELLLSAVAPSAVQGKAEDDGEETEGGVEEEVVVPGGAADDANHTGAVHCGLLHVKAAAAGALRNLIVNSFDDTVVDALAGTTVSVTAPSQWRETDEGEADVNGTSGEAVAAVPPDAGNEQVNFREGLVKLMMDMWEGVTELRSHGSPAYSEIVDRRLRRADGSSAAGSDNGDNTGTSGSCRNVIVKAELDNMPLFTYLRVLEEVLHLIAVCVEGNDEIANTLSAPHAVKSLLYLIEGSSEAAHCALRVAEPTDGPTTFDLSANKSEETLVWIEYYRCREAEIFAAVAVSGSEVLHVLSGENEALGALLLSAEAMAAHQAFLNRALDAEEAKRWLQNDVAPLAPVSTDAGGLRLTTNVMEETRSDETEDSLMLRVTRHNVLYQLCEVSLHVQGTLMNTSPTPVNAARVLPLVVAVLNTHPPHDEWCYTVPLLMQTCALSEEIRLTYLTRAQHRLRCVQAAVHVLHVVIDVICSLNEPNIDDELAFQRNEAAKLLYSHNAMFVVGKLMRDALRMPNNISNTSAASGTPTLAPFNDDRSVGGVGSSHNAAAGIGAGAGFANVQQQQQQEEDVLVEQALRAAVGTSGNVSLITKLQRLVLSNEVGVWSLANTLLLMVGWKDLGDAPSNIWRAIITALERRAQLLSRELQDDTPTAGVVSVPSPSSYSSCGRAKGGHLLRLQLESLVQMLWTLQRKQTAACGGPLEVVNHLGARAADVDVVTRLAWGADASVLKRQACVAVTCGVCTSLHTAEATEVATRFALGVLKAQRAGATEPSCCALPGSREERRRWLVGLANADAEWRVRCEAANQIMDLFLDERYHETVYLPHRVQQALATFIQQFQMYSKRRSQMQRDTMRNYKVALPEFDEEGNLGEVVENLSAFVDYKRQFMR